MKAKIALFLFAAGIGCGTAFAGATPASVQSTCQSYCMSHNGGTDNQAFRLCYTQCMAAGGVGY